MVFTPDAIFTAGGKGGLAVVSPKIGKLLSRVDLPAPVWDGLVAVPGRIVVSTWTVKWCVWGKTVDVERPAHWGNSL